MTPERRGGPHAVRVPLDTIDRCQNHVLKGSKVRRHYLHHDYASEKREAWRLLGARLFELLQPNDQSSNVVLIGRAAA